MFEIELDWPVASRYVLRPVARSPTRDVAIHPAEDATITLCRPIDQNPALYAEFAKLDGSQRGCLQFAHKYGLLRADPRYPGHDPSIVGTLEALREWRGHIKVVRTIIERCELSRANPTEAFRRFGKEDKRLSGVELYLSIKVATHPRPSMCAPKISPPP
jgi:hypothetical protein